MQHMKLFTGNSNLPLARKVAGYLRIEQGKAEVGTFSDGEVCLEIHENVRGMDCFVIQSTCAPANTNVMELLIMIDALRRSSARRITAVIPYYGYARQDRKVAPRAPISAKLMADLISVAGTDRVLCIDLHAGQIQGFFNIPVDNLYASPVLLEAIRTRFGGSQPTIISPDAGGTERARAYAKRLDARLAIIDKRRDAPNVSEVMHIVGDVRGRDCVIVDDIVDTAGTLCEAALALRKAGAEKVYAAITHPVLSGPAVKRIEESPLEELVVTDTIPLREDAQSSKIRVVSVATLLGEAIRRINNEESVSSLFV